MATITITDTTAIDESGLDQKDDVGSFPSDVAAAIQNALNTLDPLDPVQLSSAIELAGDGGDPADINDVTVSDGTVDGLSLTNADGTPLVGVATGILTLDINNNEIFLYTDGTDDNVVLGLEGNGNTADPTGDVVFAIYLEEIFTDGVITGGEFWMALFEPLRHGDNNSSDESVNLFEKLYVSGTETNDISFEGAPSGQNAFMAFGEPDGMAVIVTGETPDDTVNSGQGGNNPNTQDKTALGTNSQSIDAQQKLYFTFVMDMASNGDPDDPHDFIAPDLTATEASDPDNIQFGDVFGSSGASFSVVKVTGGGPTTSPDITISAWNTEDLASGNLEEGAAFIPGQGDDVQVNITSVQVNGIDSTDPSATFTVTVLPSSSVTIQGVVENDRISYTTEGDHNRLVIENSEPDGSNDAFSVAGFGILSSSSATTEAGSSLLFHDDGPGVNDPIGDLTIVLDETRPEGDDLGGPNDAVGDASTTADIFGDPDPGDFGTDGGDTVTYTLELTIANPEEPIGSGMYALDPTDTDDIAVDGDGIGRGEEIILSQEVLTGHIVGTSGDGSVEHFRISIDGDGLLTFSQSVNVWHGDPTDPDDTSTLNINGGTLFAVQTITDVEGDTDTAMRNLGEGVFGIEDDGPTAAVDPEVEVGMATVDESPVPPDGDGIASATFSVGNNFVTPVDYGTDGPGSVAYALELSGADVASGLFALDPNGGPDAGDPIVLNLVGGVIVGTSSAGEHFQISIDGNGLVTFSQSKNVWHADTTDPDDTEALTIDGEGEFLRAVQTVTDADGDTASATLDLSAGVFNIQDDGPGVTVDNATGGYDAGAQSTWSDADGTDGFGSFDVTLVSYEIGTNGDVQVNTSLTSTGDYSFEGTITDDFNGDGDPDTLDFTLTFDPVGDTYNLQVVEPPTGITEISTADGSLAAGGPDPVQTLVVPDGEGGDINIVFSAVDPTVDPTLITGVDGILNLTESEIEDRAGLPDSDPERIDYLSDDQMNVSTAGIGNANNNFDGNDLSGVDGGDEPEGIPPDESFVVDPTDFDVSSMKVFIDNSVGGYDFDPNNPNKIPEELYYRVYYNDGQISDLTLVTDADLSPEAGGQVSFVVGDPTGESNIDGVQFFMGTGTIKIPVIEFTTTEVFDPEPLSLDFSAELFDTDGDSATNTFTVDVNVDDGMMMG